MGRAGSLIWTTVVGVALMVVMSAKGNSADHAQLVLAKYGINDLTQQQRVDLWKRVDDYANVDAVHEFCGRGLNLRVRAWKAVGTCVERSSFRKVLREFRSKKAKYKKEWEKMDIEKSERQAICKNLQPKLREYAKIISKEINEAARSCDACLICW